MITLTAREAAEKSDADAKGRGDQIVQAAKDLAKDITDKAKEEAKKIDDAKATSQTK